MDQVNDTVQRFKVVADAMNGSPVDYAILEAEMGLVEGTGEDVYTDIANMAANVAGANATMKNYYKA